jgi:hypothetical protein
VGSYIVDLYHRASTHQALTSRERAALKAVQGALLGVLIAWLPQFINLLTGKASISFSATIIDAMVGAGLTFLLKLWSSQGPEEAVIGQIVEAYMDAKLEADAPGSVALAQNWQAIQFTVPIQPRPVEVAQAKVKVAPVKPGYISMPAAAGNAATAQVYPNGPTSMHTGTTDPSTPALSYPTFQAPPAPAPHIADTNTASIPAVNFMPPAPQP